MALPLVLGAARLLTSSGRLLRLADGLFGGGGSIQIPTLKIEVKGLAEAQRALEQFSEARMRSMLSDALNRTAIFVRDDLRDNARVVLDQPKPFTVGAIQFTRATPQRLQASVQVRPDSPAAPALVTQAVGGRREQKRFEKLGRDLGLPSGWLAMPADAADLDQHGNIRRSQLNAIIRQLGGSVGKQRRSTGIYFTARKNGVPYAVYVRHGREAKPVLWFHPVATYRPRWDFYGVARLSTEARAPAAARAAMDQQVDRWMKKYAGR